MKENNIEYINSLAGTDEKEKYEQLSMFECGRDNSR